VSAATILSDDALRRALDLGEDISVTHVFVDQDDSPADHIWRLNSQERANLRKYLSSGDHRFETRLSPNKPDSAI
jgi:hypothetical protein